MTLRTPQWAVLFDLDGTLVDTAPDLINALAALCAHVNQPLPAREDWSGLVSQGAAGLIEAALGPLDPAEMQRHLAYFLAHYEHHIFEDSRLFEGVGPLLAFCQSNGWALGVVTNKKHAFAQKILDQAGLSHCFGAVIGGDSLARNKPAPDPVWRACERLGALPEHAVLIGDDQRDVVAAQRAGVASMVVGWGYGVARIEPEILAECPVCHTPAEVGEWLQGWAR